MPDKSVARRLLIKPNSTVLLVNAPKDYASRIGPLPEGVFIVKKLGVKVDFIQLFVESRRELEEHVPRLKPLLGPAGIFWVTYRKGTSGSPSDIDRDSVAAYARTLGLHAVTQIAVDGDWSAMRLTVI
jgi:hypothetical protein